MIRIQNKEFTPSDSYYLSIGAGENQLPLILAAKNRGLKVISVDKNSEAIGFKYSNIKILESVTEYRKILKSLSEIPMDFPIIGMGCRSFGKATHTASYIAQKLGLLFPSLGSIEYFLNKFELNKTLSRRGVILPEIIHLFNNKNSLSSLKNLKYPLIIKPVSGHGKKNILKISNENDFLKFNKLKMRNDDSYIIEKFIEGEEITVLGFIQNKVFQLVSIVKKDTTLVEPFIELVHELPFYSDKILGEIFLTINTIIQITELDNSPITLEFKITNQRECYLIEVVPEIGGEYLADYLIPSFYNYDYFKNYLKLTLGEKVQTVSKIKQKNKKGFISFLLPDTNNKIIKNIRPFLLEKNEFLFLEKNLKNTNDKISFVDGNSSRVKVIGLIIESEKSTEEIKKSIQKRLTCEYK